MKLFVLFVAFLSGHTINTVMSARVPVFEKTTIAYEENFSGTTSLNTSSPENLKCGSDNTNCALSTRGTHVQLCPSGYWKCDNEKCIRAIFRCGGDFNDCGDESDERNCPINKIVEPIDSCSSSTEWLCKNGKCIRAIFRCDSEDDCGDGSDEQKCPVRINSIPNSL